MRHRERMAEKWISVTDAVHLTGYSRKQILRVVNSKKVTGRRFASVWQIDRDSLLAYVRQKRQEGAKPGPKPKV